MKVENLYVSESTELYINDFRLRTGKNNFLICETIMIKLTLNV